MEQSYRRETVAQVLRFYDRWPRGWSLDGLLKIYSEVAAAVGRRKTVRGKWSVRLGKLARIMIGEQERLRAAESFEQLRKMKQSSEQQSGGLKVTQITRR